MTWAKVEDTLWYNPKLRRLSRALGCSRHEAMAYLVLLWLWALTNAPGGDLSGLEAEDLAEGAHWAGDPAAFVRALEETRWIDPEGTIHDWHEYGGKLAEKRTKNAGRMRDARAQDVQRTCVARAPLEKSREEESREEKSSAFCAPAPEAPAHVGADPDDADGWETLPAHPPLSPEPSKPSLVVHWVEPSQGSAAPTGDNAVLDRQEAAPEGGGGTSGPSAKSTALQSPLNATAVRPSQGLAPGESARLLSACSAIGTQGPAYLWREASRQLGLHWDAWEREKRLAWLEAAVTKAAGQARGSPNPYALRCLVGWFEAGEDPLAAPAANTKLDIFDAYAEGNYDR